MLHTNAFIAEKQEWLMLDPGISDCNAECKKIWLYVWMFCSSLVVASIVAGGLAQTVRLNIPHQTVAQHWIRPTWPWRRHFTALCSRTTPDGVEGTEGDLAKKLRTSLSCYVCDPTYVCTWRHRWSAPGSSLLWYVSPNPPCNCSQSIAASSVMRRNTT